MRVSTFGGFGLESSMVGLASTSTAVGLVLPNTQNTQNWLECSHDWKFSKCKGPRFSGNDAKCFLLCTVACLASVPRHS
jgi:hypothetical protein